MYTDTISCWIQRNVADNKEGKANLKVKFLKEKIEINDVKEMDGHESKVTSTVQKIKGKNTLAYNI